MFRNFSLGKKLTLGFAFVLVLSILVIVVAMMYMGEIANSTKELFEYPYTVHTEILEVQRNVIDMDREVVKILLAADPVAQQEYADFINELERETLEAFDSLYERFLDDHILLDGALQAITDWKPIRDEVIRLAISRQFIQATNMNMERNAPQVALIEEQLQGIVNFARASALQYNEGSQRNAKSASTTMLILLIALLLVAILAIYLITRSIAKPLSNLVALAQGVAQGNLGMEAVDYQGRDEIGTLTGALNMMKENLREMARVVMEAANVVHSSSEQLSAATQETSASAEELASTSSNFAGAVERVSSNAQEMASSAQHTNELSLQGAQEIERAVQTMDTIYEVVIGLTDDIRSLSHQSEKIEQIVTLITGIAEQTNLLALNAAIEAARAGEQGRGFAVVADEVRKLAEQSAEATGKITQVIHEIRDSAQHSVERADIGAGRVKEGVDVVTSTGQMFGDIAAIIESLVQEINYVALASQELSSGASEMRATTEEQSATTEQMAASAAEMARAASTVHEQMSRFKL